MFVLRTVADTEIPSCSMEPRWNVLWRSVFYVAIVLGFTFALLSKAQAAVQTCDESGLNAALAAGGTNTFSCAFPTVVTVSSSKTVSVSGTVLDGGGRLTISGGGAFRVFAVNSGVTATFQNLTITNGFSNGASGIFNAGTTIINNCTFSANATLTGSAGAIQNVGTALTISGSTFLGNSASSGGAIANQAPLAISNSTFANNSASQVGGAILIVSGPVTIINSTISGNSAAVAFGGGGIFGTATLENTIVANNYANGAMNCNGAITAGADSMSDDATCGSATQKTLAQIGLGALTGSPSYFPLNSGSAAIDAGNNAYCAAAPVNNTSQNGVTRPTDGDNNGSAICDIGSYEVPAAVANSTSVPTLQQWTFVLLELLLFLTASNHYLRTRKERS